VIVGFNFAGENDNPRALASDFPRVEQLRAPMKSAIAAPTIN